MRNGIASWCAGAILAPAMAIGAGAAQPAAPPPRVEARSADIFAVGVVHGDKMTIRLSQVLDNAPLRDAAVRVLLRGATYATTAETDGSYTLQTKDLLLPGAAAIEFQVSQAAAQQSLTGTLQINAEAAGPDDRNGARALWWWVLNFGVCIGFLWLVSRRRKTAQSKEPV